MDLHIRKKCWRTEAPAEPLRDSAGKRGLGGGLGDNVDWVIMEVALVGSG